MAPSTTPHATPQSCNIQFMERDELYALIVEQLVEDGYQKVAEQLVANGVPRASQHTPRNQLLRLFGRKLGEGDEDSSAVKQVHGDYVTRYIATCKDPVVCAGFSSAGDFAAVASEDCSVKVLEVDKMQTNVEVKGERAGEYESTNPVYKTIYDHARVS